jgi:hypothetical protein
MRAKLNMFIRDKYTASALGTSSEATMNISNNNYYQLSQSMRVGGEHSSDNMRNV